MPQFITILRRRNPFVVVLYLDLQLDEAGLPVGGAARASADATSGARKSSLDNRVRSLRLDVDGFLTNSGYAHKHVYARLAPSRYIGTALPGPEAVPPSAGTNARHDAGGSQRAWLLESQNRYPFNLLSSLNFRVGGPCAGVKLILKAVRRRRLLRVLLSRCALMLRFRFIGRLLPDATSRHGVLILGPSPSSLSLSDSTITPSRSAGTYSI